MQVLADGAENARELLLLALRARGIDPESLRTEEDGTMTRIDTPLFDADWQAEELGDLPPARGGMTDLVSPGEELIGTGGMAFVRAATQPALKRRVAVKELRKDASPAAMVALMREAWAAGNLDHPNIVPVHLLCRQDQSPLLVMKRIEGVAWSRVLKGGEAAAGFPIKDRLEWHVRVLVQLCQAVHFAHTRGVLHLDLKPDNVMLGAFGEVYLLDWGVAASIGDDGPPWLPHAREIRSISGTPGYMSREMAAAEHALLGVTSDVYTLGAILHEIVVGEKRHRGASLIDVLASSFASVPYAYDDTVPPDLAQVCNRATARDPAARFPSAESFRRALESFLHHRSATRLSGIALRRLAELHHAAVRPAADDGLEERELERAFGECRFALEQSREIWPENPDVREGLQTLSTLMAKRALAEGNADWAASMIAELPEPDEELSSRLATLQERKSDDLAHQRKLEHLEHQWDLGVYNRPRSTLALLTGLAWLLWNVGAGYLHHEQVLPLAYGPLIASSVATLAVFVLVVLHYRGMLLQTLVNRRVIGLFGAGCAAVLPFFAMCWRFDVAPLHAVALSSAIYFFLALALASGVDRRALYALLPLLPLAVLATLVPDYAFPLSGAMGFALGAVLAFVWRAPEPQVVTARKARDEME